MILISSFWVFFKGNIFFFFFFYSDEQSEKVVNKLCELLNKDYGSYNVKYYIIFWNKKKKSNLFLCVQVNRGLQSSIITALLKYVSKTKVCSDEIMEAVIKCRESSSGDIKQVCAIINLIFPFFFLDEFF